MTVFDVEWQASKNNLDLTGASANGELPYHQQFGSTSDSWVNHLPNYMTVTGAGGSTSIDPSDYDQVNNVVYAPVGDTNWWDEISQLGWMQNHQLSLSGGTDKGQYTMSMNYFDQQGTAIESYFTRYQARANSSYNVRPWLRFGENLTYSFSKNNGLSFSGTDPTSTHGLIGPLLMYRFMTMRAIMQAPYSPGPQFPESCSYS